MKQYIDHYISCRRGYVPSEFMDSFFMTLVTTTIFGCMRFSPVTQVVPLEDRTEESIRTIVQSLAILLARPDRKQNGDLLISINMMRMFCNIAVKYSAPTHSQEEFVHAWARRLMHVI
jgi:hypothetical protein